MNNIEVEIRSFITKEKYEELLDFFNQNGKLLAEDSQETYYFDAPQDLRIQKNNYFSKVWLKKGKIHDEFREQTEIKFDRNEFEKLEQLFKSLGYDIAVKWYRKRHVYKWSDIDVCIDHTKGYGYIIELEIMTTEKYKEQVLEELKQKMNELNIPLTPRKEFEEKYEHYRQNWERLIKE